MAESLCMQLITMGEIGEHHRDIRNNRKAQKNRRKKVRNQQKKLKDQKDGLQKEKENQTQPRRCRDWIILTYGVQYAKNRSSFKTYRHIPKVTLKSGGVAVGKGKVELEVLRSPGSSESHTLVLKDVLHIPEALCNGITIPEGTRTTTFRPVMQGFDEEGRPYWYGHDFRGLSKLALAGNDEGESPLQDIEAHPGPLWLSATLTERGE